MTLYLPVFRPEKSYTDFGIGTSLLRGKGSTMFLPETGRVMWQMIGNKRCFYMEGSTNRHHRNLSTGRGTLGHQVSDFEGPEC